MNESSLFTAISATKVVTNNHSSTYLLLHLNLEGESSNAVVNIFHKNYLTPSTLSLNANRLGAVVIQANNCYQTVDYRNSDT